MYRTKKVLSIIMAFLLVFAVLPIGVQALIVKPGIATIVPPIKPVQVKRVTYQLKAGVQTLPMSASKMFAIDKNSYVLNKNIKNFNPNKGQIFVDAQTKSVMQVVSSSADASGRKTFKMVKPPLEDVFSDFEIPEQTLKPNAANVKTENGVTFSSSKGSIISQQSSVNGIKMASGQDNKLSDIHRFDLLNFKILSLKSKDGSSFIEIKANGFIELQEPKITLEGKFDDGFKVGFTAYEKAEVKITGKAAINEKVTLPIATYTLPFAVGEAYVGVYLVCEVNGDIYVEIKVEQGIGIDAGISGKLWYFIPYDVDGYCELNNYFKVTTVLDGKIHARAAIVPKAGFVLFGYQIGELSMSLGLEADAVISLSNVDAKIDAVFDVMGVLFRKDYALYKKVWNIYKTTKRYTAGCDINVSKADSYNDRVEGTILKEKQPYNGGAGIIVLDKNNIVKGNLIPVQCTNGIFSADIPLLYTDKVVVKVQVKEKSGADINAQTDPVKVTVPFDQVVVTEADAYNNKIKGFVSGNYTGPVSIAAGAPGKGEIYDTECINGIFEYSPDELWATDQVTASLNYEGFQLSSIPVKATVPLKINVFADEKGIRGTIENTKGDDGSYLGKATLIFKDVNKNESQIGVVRISTDRVEQEEVTDSTEGAVENDEEVAENDEPDDGEVQTGDSDIVIEWERPENGIDIDPLEDDSYFYTIQAAGKTTYFAYGKFKCPERSMFLWQAIYATIEFEGVTIRGAYFIAPENELPSPNQVFTQAVESPIDYRIDSIINPGDAINNKIDTPQIDEQIINIR